MMGREEYLKPDAIRVVEESFENDKEAYKLLELIHAEFESDPMSVQCFDVRIVKRVKLCVARYNQYRSRLPFAI